MRDAERDNTWTYSTPMPLPREVLVLRLPEGVHVTTELALEALQDVAESAYAEWLGLGLVAAHDRDICRRLGDPDADALARAAEDCGRQAQYWRDKALLIARARTVPVVRA